MHQRDLSNNLLPLPWIASTEPEERYIAKRKRKEELLNNMMMLLAPSVLNPCILPLLDTVTTFFPRLIIIQHIKRRRRVRFEEIRDRPPSCIFSSCRKEPPFHFSVFTTHAGWEGGREQRWGNSLTLLGSARRRAPGCVIAAGKARQMR